jgi:hypothetical protein
MSQVIIDGELCDKARKVLEETLKEPLAKLGLKVESKRWTYYPADAEIRVPSFKIRTIDALPEEVLALRHELNNRRNYNFLLELDGDRVVEINAKRIGKQKVKLWGFNPKSKTKPFRAKLLEDMNNPDSAYYPMSVEQVERLWGEKPLDLKQ